MSGLLGDTAWVAQAARDLNGGGIERFVLHAIANHVGDFLRLDQAVAAVDVKAYLDETARDEFLELFESGPIRDKLLKLPVLRLTEDGIGFLESSLIPRSGVVTP